MMDCFLLGSGGMMPMPYRMLTSMAVRTNGRIYLFDAGEGAQLGWKQLGLGLRRLQLIAITHLHADHCLGLPGLLMLRAQMDEPDPLTILGPPGIQDFVEGLQRAIEFYCNYTIRFHQWADGCANVAYEDEEVRILWRPLKHTRFCLGYRLEEKDRPGRFDPDRASALGIPPGPLRTQLQRGSAILNGAGERIESRDVVGPPRPGRKVAFVVDTRPASAILELCRGADLAFIEGMFRPEDASHATAKGHLTTLEAAAIAAESGVRETVLVHISPRYSNDELGALESEARLRCPRLTVGRDLAVYPVAAPE
ncbi:MAG: ribonuclease Z [Syntrophobacteraceae bacterium]